MRTLSEATPSESRTRTLKQLDFDFTDVNGVSAEFLNEEKTWPSCIDCKEGCLFCSP